MSHYYPGLSSGDATALRSDSPQAEPMVDLDAVSKNSDVFPDIVPSVPALSLSLDLPASRFRLPSLQTSWSAEEREFLQLPLQDDLVDPSSMAAPPPLGFASAPSPWWDNTLPPISSGMNEFQSSSTDPFFGGQQPQQQGVVAPIFDTLSRSSSPNSSSYYSPSSEAPSPPRYVHLSELSLASPPSPSGARPSHHSQRERRITAAGDSEPLLSDTTTPDAAPWEEEANARSNDVMAADNSSDYTPSYPSDAEYSTRSSRGSDSERGRGPRRRRTNVEYVARGGSEGGEQQQQQQPSSSSSSIGPLPAPIPVPNLTKKSRGRKVPVATAAAIADDSSGGGGGSSNGTTANVMGERTHVCPVPNCGKGFVRGEHLKRHIRSIHTHDKRQLALPFLFFLF
jgi:hypothetical protein